MDGFLVTFSGFLDVTFILRLYLSSSSFLSKAHPFFPWPPSDNMSAVIPSVFLLSPPLTMFPLYSPGFCSCTCTPF